MSKTRYNLDLVFANIFFGANFSFYVSLTRNYLDFQQIFMLQVLSGAIFFIPFALFSKQSFRIRWRDAGNILVVTMLIVYGWMYMLLWGSSYTSPIDASIISTLGPAVTLIMDHIMHPHKYIKARVYNLVTQICQAFQEFNGPFIITNGGPRGSTTLISILVYNYAFKSNQMGMASALAWIMFVIVCILTIIAFTSQKKWVYYSDER